MVTHYHPPGSEGPSQPLSLTTGQKASNSSVTGQISGSHESGEIGPSLDLEISDAEFLRTLPDSVHRNLLDNFWTSYHCEVQSVYRQTFELGMRIKNPETYSPFLHLCILGIGARYSDDTDEGYASLFPFSEKISIFHLRATRIVKALIEGPSEVCLIQGLLLYGDLEFSIGRYNNGWMHASEPTFRACLSGQLTYQRFSRSAMSSIWLPFRTIRRYVT